MTTHYESNGWALNNGSFSTPLRTIPVLRHPDIRLRVQTLTMTGGSPRLTITITYQFDDATETQQFVLYRPVAAEYECAYDGRGGHYRVTATAVAVGRVTGNFALVEFAEGEAIPEWP